MAQSGYTPISLYFSATGAAVPTAGNLVAGELALNTNDGKLYFKNSSGVVTLLAGSTSGPAGGSTTQVQYNNSGVLAGITGATTNGTALTLVAPVLGTPASGTVTNLTGTASININGTVGATTANTGAFTTLSSTTGSNFATSSGSVGVGTSSPATYGGFSVRRAVTTADTTNCSASFSDAANSTLDIGHTSGLVTINAQGGSLAFNAASSERGRFSSTGLAVTGTLSATGTLSGGTSGTGYSFSGSAPATSLTLDSSGDVGIGTTTPYQKFEVTANSSIAYGGTGRRVGSFLATAAAVVDRPGISLGYDTAGAGIIAADTNSLGQPIAFWTYNGSAWGERARISKEGDVGIGTSSPTMTASNRVVIDVNGTTSSVIAQSSGGTTRGYGYVDSTQMIYGSKTAIPLIFQTTETERARIDSSGNLGVGTTSTPTGASAPSRFITVAGSNDGVLQLTRTSATAGGGAIASAAGPGMLFYTHTGTVGAETYTERARIDSSGNLLVGTTSFTTSASASAGVSGGNFRSLQNTTTIPGLTTATVLTLSSSVSGVYIVQANFGPQSNEIYGGMLIVVANNGSFRIVTNGGGASSVLALSGANVQMTNAVGSTLDAYASAVLIAN